MSGRRIALADSHSTAQPQPMRHNYKIFIPKVITKDLDSLPEKVKEAAKKMYQAAEARGMEKVAQEALIDYGNIENNIFVLYLNRLASALESGILDSKEIRDELKGVMVEYPDKADSVYAVAEKAAKEIGSVGNINLSKVIPEIVHRVIAKGGTGCPNELFGLLIDMAIRGEFNDVAPELSEHIAEKTGNVEIIASGQVISDPKVSQLEVTTTAIEMSTQTAVRLETAPVLGQLAELSTSLPLSEPIIIDRSITVRQIDNMQIAIRINSDGMTVARESPVSRVIDSQRIPVNNRDIPIIREPSLARVNYATQEIKEKAKREERKEAEADVTRRRANEKAKPESVKAEAPIKKWTFNKRPATDRNKLMKINGEKPAVKYKETKGPNEKPNHAKQVHEKPKIIYKIAKEKEAKKKFENSKKNKLTSKEKKKELAKLKPESDRLKGKEKNKEGKKLSKDRKKRPKELARKTKEKSGKQKHENEQNRVNEAKIKQKENANYKKNVITRNKRSRKHQKKDDNAKVKQEKIYDKKKRPDSKSKNKKKWLNRMINPSFFSVGKKRQRK